MPKPPMPSPDLAPDDLLDESRRMRERLLLAAADVEAWTAVLREALTHIDDDDA